MKVVIVGHRGTGKTSLLHRLQNRKGRSPFLQPDVPFFDLDQEIEKTAGQSIADLFKVGEPEFRKWELQTFSKISKLPSFVMSVGGGFPAEVIPSDMKVWWVRRDTDQNGRIFFNRPRLESDEHPLKEFEIRRQHREPKFQSRADLIYTMPEGNFSSTRALEIENEILSETPKSNSGIKTLWPRDLDRSQVHAALFELRDDLLTTNEIERAFKKISSDRILFSLRCEQMIPEFILASSCMIDVDHALWAKLSSRPPASRLVISSHDGSVEEMIRYFSEFEEKGAHFKMCPVISSWQELQKGHEWQQQNPKQRSFLPRSTSGKWTWYRLYQKSRQKINFWRDGYSPVSDQPTLFQWLSTPHSFSQFAAVLGSPVHHSYSPLFHLDFFSKSQMPVFAVEVSEADWAEALPFLRNLGLKAAAVTSPLKLVAFASSNTFTETAAKLKSANTIVRTENGWLAHNTDISGFKEFYSSTNTQSPAVIWGGGGTVSTIKTVIPGVSSYSSQAGKPRSGEIEVDNPSTVIWAAPNHPQTQSPPSHWKPQAVLDLSYKENSLARLYAIESQASYFSGLDFFRYQALEQQQFWSDYL